VAESLRALGVPVVWLGADGGMETRVVPAHGIDLHTVAVGGLRGKGLRTRLAAPLMLMRSLMASRKLLGSLRPRSVLSMGGYVAGPAGIATWMSGRPLLVHEQNRVAGFTNKVLARLARRVLVGNPVRAVIAALPAPEQRFDGRHDRRRLLILGGSLGARALNLNVPAALALLPEEHRPEVLHQCGARGVEEARKAYADAGVVARIEPFIEDMAAAYGWADLAVCRAGALTIAELTAAGLGAVLIPFPHAVDDHQTRNAQTLVAAGAAELVPERGMDTAALSTRLRELLGDRHRMLSMAQAARSLAKPDAAAAIARACLEVAA
jgi:UDP-N-acetylglucosamine--N-acetylmuramyl-(pentapeptide) pyrophosphoryl-undecaprenol N-acetylglucosamine transferase